MVPSVGVGRHIHQLRKQQHRTLPDIARAAGLSHQYVSKIERGLVRNLGIQTLGRLAQVLGVSVAELVTTIPPALVPVPESPVALNQQLRQQIRSLLQESRVVLAQQHFLVTQALALLGEAPGDTFTRTATVLQSSLG